MFPVIAEVVTAKQGDPRRAVEAAGPVDVVQVGAVPHGSVGEKRANEKKLQGTQQRGENAVEPYIGEGKWVSPGGDHPEGEPQES